MPEGDDHWLDLTVSDLERLRPLLGPFRTAAMEACPVVRLVSRIDREGPKLIWPWPWRKERYEEAA